MKKTPRAVIAAVAGAALLLGGGSYALWNSTAESSTQANIQTGSSSLTQEDAGAWLSVGDIIPDVTAYRIVPGDSIYFRHSFNLKTEGKSMKTRVAFNFENDAAMGIKALRERGITFTNMAIDNVTSRALGVANPVGDSLNFAFNQNGPTPAAGLSFRLETVVKFAEAATAEDLKLLSFVIGNAVVTAGQTN